MVTNTSKTIESKDKLILEILYDEFGYYLVNRALTYKDFYKCFKIHNPSVMSDISNALSHNWQMGKARQYVESLEECVQGCLICYLAEHYVNDKTRSDYL